DKQTEPRGGDKKGGPPAHGWGTGGPGAPTVAPPASALRSRQQRAMLTTLLLSFGLPLLLGGDEIGRTQGGNNNAYCQDNVISWFDWDAVNQDLRAYVKRVIAVRVSAPGFPREGVLTAAERSDPA